MGKKIAFLLEDKELRRVFVDRAYKKVMEKYSWSSIAQEMLELYKKLEEQQ